MTAIAGRLRPTFHGFVATTVDAAYLVETAALVGTMPLARALLSADEGCSFICSGTIVVYPIGGDYPGHDWWVDSRRWTSSSPLPNNGFEVYRELPANPQVGNRFKLTQAQVVSATAQFSLAFNLS
jgi:hypothetical protein